MRGFEQQISVCSVDMTKGPLWMARNWAMLDSVLEHEFSEAGRIQALLRVLGGSLSKETSWQALNLLSG